MMSLRNNDCQKKLEKRYNKTFYQVDESRIADQFPGFVTVWRIL
jgi:hypothetical protein